MSSIVMFNYTEHNISLGLGVDVDEVSVGPDPLKLVEVGRLVFGPLLVIPETVSTLIN